MATFSFYISFVKNIIKYLLTNFRWRKIERIWGGRIDALASDLITKNMASDPFCFDSFDPGVDRVFLRFDAGDSLGAEEIESAGVMQ